MKNKGHSITIANLSLFNEEGEEFIVADNLSKSEAKKIFENMKFKEAIRLLKTKKLAKTTNQHY